MLVVAEFCTVCRVFVEPVTRNGCDNLNAGRFRWDGEVHLTEIPRFVVVGSIELASAESIRAVDGASTASPIAEEERDGQVAFVGTGVFESTLFAVVQHEKVG